jgi:hypothetical protein
MKKQLLIATVPMVLFAANGFAQGDDRAVPRGSGGGSSSSAGERHTGGSSGSSSSSSSAGSDRSYSGGSQDSYIPDAATRRPRPGSGSGRRNEWGGNGGDRDRYNGYPNSYYYYDPYSYSWGYRPYSRYGYGYGYGYSDYGYSYGDYWGYYPSYGYRSYRYRSGNVSQVRTLVEPAKARVYVDGYYAGIADDFDGIFQRLNVSPGRHEITFRLDGYKSHTFSIYANRNQTLKLRADLAKGAGDTRESIGYENPGREEDVDDEADERADSRDRRDPSREVDAQQDSTRDRRYVPPTDRQGGLGEVFFEIEPADASVYVDGEFFGKASQLARVELPEGRHRIEVVRPGYKTEETEVEVGRDGKKVVVRLERR